MLSQVIRPLDEDVKDVSSSTPAGCASTGGVETGPVVVSHVVNQHHHYPGELMTLYTRVAVQEAHADLTLRVTVPEGLVLGVYRGLHELGNVLPQVEVEGDTHFLVWSLKGKITAGTRYEFQAEARVAPVSRNQTTTSRAVLTNQDDEVLAEETATFHIRHKGQYLRQLPELYEEDEFMGHFLMLFESFWKPIHTQIGSISHFFDPDLTPSRWLPWLASWLGLELDERFPEERQRQLIRSAVWLYRRRGTKQALQKYLELYSGGQVQITEHRARDFRLGPDVQLGSGVALGIGNRPHTFAVSLRLPPIPSGVIDEEERTRLEAKRRRAIETIIESFKPAHTAYNLQIETLSEGDRG